MKVFGSLPAIAGLIFALCGSASADDKIEWLTDLEKARETARETHRPLLLFVTTTGCPYCVKMKNESLENSAVVEEIKQKYVAAIILALDHPRARQQLFNIAMDEPVDYRKLADHLEATRGLPAVEVPTAFHGTWLDNTKARFLLGWRPHYDLPRLADAAWDYYRAPDDPRKVWYPG